MNTQTPFMIMSADRAEYGADINAERRKLLVRQFEARGLSFKEVEGSYNGTKETSYVIPVHSSGDESLVLTLARRYGQESVLSVDANRFATLLYLHSDMGGPDVKAVEPVGHWRALDASEPDPASYTRDGSQRYTTAAHP